MTSTVREFKELFMPEEQVYTCVIAADVGTGQLKQTADVSIAGSQPIVPAGTGAAGQNLGSVWKLDSGQNLQFKFSIPAAAANFRISVYCVGLNAAGSHLKTQANSSSTTTASVSQQSVTNVGASGGGLATGENLLTITNPQGTIGIQGVKINYDLPRPQLTIGPGDPAGTLTIQSPLPGATLPAGTETRVEWRCSDIGADTFLSLSYQAGNGLTLPLIDGPGILTPAFQKVPTGGGLDWTPSSDLNGATQIAIAQADVTLAVDDGPIINFDPPTTPSGGVYLSKRANILVVDNPNPFAAGTGAANCDLYDLLNGTKILNFSGPPFRAVPAIWEDARYLVAASNGGLAVVDAASQSVLRNFTITGMFPFGARLFLVLGQPVVIFLQGNDTFSRVNLESGSVTPVYQSPPYAVAYDLSVDGAYLAVSTSNQLCLIAVATGNALWRQNWQTQFCKFSPAGDLLLVCNQTGTAPGAGGLATFEFLVVDPQNGNVKSSFPNALGDRGLFKACVSPDSTLIGVALAFTGDDQFMYKGKIRLLDAQSGMIKKEADSMAYYTMAFTPDSSHLIHDETDIRLNVGLGGSPSLKSVSALSTTSSTT
jgi:hypothetical protein